MYLSFLLCLSNILKIANSCVAMLLPEVMGFKVHVLSFSFVYIDMHGAFTFFIYKTVPIIVINDFLYGGFTMD
jgi:hypothetical protein